jgi:hypothetical protein
VLEAGGDGVVTGSTKAMAKSSGEFGHIEGTHDEIVEEVFAKGEIVELVVVEEQDNRTHRALSVTQLATQIHRVTKREGRRVNHRTRESLGWLGRRDVVQARSVHHHG